MMQSLLQEQLTEIEALCRRLHVRRLDVFGSAARGDFDPEASDLDFLVEFEALPPVEYADAYFSLREGLESLFGRPVDLVTAASIVNPYFRESVSSSRENVYAA
jgi:predicted nucleotidyltransferase